MATNLLFEGGELSPFVLSHPLDRSEKERSEGVEQIVVRLYHLRQLRVWNDEGETTNDLSFVLVMEIVHSGDSERRTRVERLAIVDSSGSRAEKRVGDERIDENQSVDQSGIAAKTSQHP